MEKKGLPGVFLDRALAVGSENELNQTWLLTAAERYRAVKGICNVELWQNTQGNDCLIIGDIEDLLIAPKLSDSLDTTVQAPDWAGTRLWVGSQIYPGSKYAVTGQAMLLNVYLQMPPEMLEEFNDWYNTEHIPRLLDVPGCTAARRFHVESGQPTYLAVYYLANPDVLLTPEWEQAAKTPWRDRVMSRYTSLTRAIYRPVKTT